MLLISIEIRSAEGNLPVNYQWSSKVITSKKYESVGNYLPTIRHCSRHIDNLSTTRNSRHICSSTVSKSFTEDNPGKYREHELMSYFKVL